MVAEPPAESATDAPIDRDLYCLTCGYNLRGLSGDPVRCPECGNRNPVDDIQLPAEIISRQLRRMEWAPAICIGAIILGLPLLAVFGGMLIAMAGHWHAKQLFCVSVPTAGCVLAWIIGAARFRASCLGKPGWGTTLSVYHVYGLLLVGATLGVMALGAWLLWPLTAVSRGPYDGLIFASVMTLLCLVVILNVRAGLKPIHARMTETMRGLQREVAVTIAREQVRKKLAQEHRRLLG